MSTSKSSSESSVNSSAKTGSSAVDGCDSSDLEWKKTDPPSASAGTNASSSASATSGSDESSSTSGAPLPGPAGQQVQQPRPSTISQYGGTYAVNDACQTLREFHGDR